MCSPPQQGLELSGDRLQGVLLRHEVSVRAAQVAHQDHRFGPFVQAVLDAGNSGLDPKKTANPSKRLFSNELFVCGIKLMFLNHSSLCDGFYLWLLVICLSFIGTLKSTLKDKKTDVL